jgi:hypothetical protein
VSRHSRSDGLRPASRWQKDLPFWILVGVLGVLGAAFLLLVGVVLTIVLVAVIG